MEGFFFLQTMLLLIFALSSRSAIIRQMDPLRCTGKMSWNTYVSRQTLGGSIADFLGKCDLQSGGLYV